MIELPEICYAAHPEDGHVVVIKRGESGYCESWFDVGEGVTPEALNTSMGITSEESAAMLAGAMFGWDCPAAKDETWPHGWWILPGMVFGAITYAVVVAVICFW